MEDFLFHLIMYALTLVGGVGLGAQLRLWWTDYEIKRLRKIIEQRHFGHR